MTRRLSVELIDQRAARLKEARARRYSSTGAAARALGIGASTLRAHENGQNGFTPDAARLYAKMYGVTVDWLFWGRAAGSGEHHPPDRGTPISIIGSTKGRARLELSADLPMDVALKIAALVEEAQR